jgi:hypothetical protein
MSVCGEFEGVLPTSPFGGRYGLSIALSIVYDGLD